MKLWKFNDWFIFLFFFFFLFFCFVCVYMRPAECKAKQTNKEESQWNRNEFETGWTENLRLKEDVTDYVDVFWNATETVLLIAEWINWGRHGNRNDNQLLNRVGFSLHIIFFLSLFLCYYYFFKYWITMWRDAQTHAHAYSWAATLQTLLTLLTLLTLQTLQTLHVTYHNC